MKSIITRMSRAALLAAALVLGACGLAEERSPASPAAPGSESAQPMSRESGEPLELATAAATCPATTCGAERYLGCLANSCTHNGVSYRGEVYEKTCTRWTFSYTTGCVSSTYKVRRSSCTASCSTGGMMW